jgi:hypothetical protein
MVVVMVAKAVGCRPTTLGQTEGRKDGRTDERKQCSGGVRGDDGGGDGGGKGGGVSPDHVRTEEPLLIRGDDFKSWT